jgi:hypothetical protein
MFLHFPLLILNSLPTTWIRLYRCLNKLAGSLTYPSVGMYKINIVYLFYALRIILWMKKERKRRKPPPVKTHKFIQCVVLRNTVKSRIWVSLLIDYIFSIMQKISIVVHIKRIEPYFFTAWLSFFFPSFFLHFYWLFGSRFECTGNPSSRKINSVLLLRPVLSDGGLSTVTKLIFGTVNILDGII